MIIRSWFFNFSSWYQQAAGRKILRRWVERYKQGSQSRKPAWSFFFFTSRKRYVPSVEPATRRLSSGHSPKSNPSSVSHNPTRAVMGHPSISCSATQVQRERKGHKGTFIIPPEYHDVPSQVALTDWTGRGPLALSVLLASTPGLH